MQQAKWLEGAVDALTDHLVQISPSEWAEKYRRLPPSVTSKPGPYDYSIMPYLREIVDSLDVRCHIRELAIMKGAQTGGTVGVLENFLGYAIAHVRTAPMIFVTATQVLASVRMDQYIMPMIEQSGLLDCIQNNSTNQRKQGATANRLNIYGGGFMIMTGAESPANARSISARFAFFDEVDGFKERLGNDGDPLALFKRRTAGFEDSRKVVTVSTPTTEEKSRIWKEYKAGDQRIFEVPCLGCGEFQELRWEHYDKSGAVKGGIVWTLDDDGRVVPGSVAYACRSCGHCHKNAHKRLLLPRGRWRATAIPIHPTIRSYHISGLMSPPGFYSWESAVIDWLKAWNVVTKQPRDRELLQEFYNNVLGKPYKLGGTKLTYARVARHVRSYKFGEIPNTLARAMCGAPLAFLTCTADVQKDFIAATVYAHGPGRIGFLVARERFDGDTSDPFDQAGPWGKLKELIETRFHDGVDRRYDVKVSLVDSNYRTAEVYAFCSQFQSGVFPLRGDVRATSGPAMEFKRIKDASTSGIAAWAVNVNHYKTRLAAVLKATPEPSTEPAAVDTVCFPEDLPNDALDELTAEEFCEVTKPNGKTEWTWKRRGRNELWDLTVYAMAARDIAAFMLCREELEFETIIWGQFWEICESGGFGWAEAPPLEPEAPREV